MGDHGGAWLLLTPPAALPDVVDAARSRLLTEDWDLVVYVTEPPLRIGRRPLLTHSSPTHGAAVVSPTCAGTDAGPPAGRSAVDAVGVLVGDTAGSQPHRTDDERRRANRRLVQLASEVEGADALEGVALLHRVVWGICGCSRAWFAPIIHGGSPRDCPTP